MGGSSPESAWLGSNGCLWRFNAAHCSRSQICEQMSVVVWIWAGRRIVIEWSVNIARGMLGHTMQGLVNPTARCDELRSTGGNFVASCARTRPGGSFRIMLLHYDASGSGSRDRGEHTDEWIDQRRIQEPRTTGQGPERDHQRPGHTRAHGATSARAHHHLDRQHRMIVRELVHHLRERDL